MATLDGYSPYPLDLTAKDAVAAIKRAHLLEETLKGYSSVYESDTPPNVAEVYNGSEFWLNTNTGRLYRGYKNSDLNIVVWFEID